MDILAATHYSIEDDKCGTETCGLAGGDDKIALQLAEQKGVLILTEKQNHHCGVQYHVLSLHQTG